MQEDIKLAFSILRGQVSSLLFILLFISGAVSVFLGEKTDGIIIFSIIFINLILGFYQEFRASKASEKLLHLVQSKVYVLRDGKLIQILSSELVLNDIVHLVAGSVAPADLEVIESQNAFIDDSMRTGETEPKEIKMGESLYSGAIVSSGKIIGHVTALGDQSSLSKYRSKLESVKKWSDFNLFVSNITKYIFISALSALLVAFFIVVFVLGKYDTVEFFIFSIALLVGVVPETLPLIITLILTRESVILAKSKVIVKRLSSLQELGAVQFLLTDKTGTITENKLKVFKVNDINNFWEASNSISEGEYERTPMDEAYDNALNISVGKIKTGMKKIKIFEPFMSSKGYASFILEGGDKIIRGQFEKVSMLCKNIPEPVKKSALEYESKGMRVIALAFGRAGEWNFSGFIAFEDPIKSSASESLRIAHERGIGVKILTGDSKAVAINVAEELGLIKSIENIISFEDVKVSDLSDKQLRRAVVFAKCTPENKLELIDRYLKLGPVAFLGDGINDALALKRADIGMAVDNAADIAKESADVLLLEKDLSPILKGISMGRKALRNILTYIIYTLSGNAGTFFSLLIASFFYPTLPMLPIQILLNNLLTDLPLMMIVTDNVDSYTLRHVPHYEPRKIMKRIFIFGILSSVFDLIYFQIYKHASVSNFQTGWFIFSVLTELVLILSIRSSRVIWKSPKVSLPLAFGIIISAILPFIFVYNSYIANAFKFSVLPINTIFVLLGIIFVYICANETAKYFMRRRNLYNKPTHPAHIFKS